MQAPQELRSWCSTPCGHFSPGSMADKQHLQCQVVTTGSKPHSWGWWGDRGHRGELVLFSLKHNGASQSSPVGRRPPPREKPWNVRNVLEPPAWAPGQERLGSTGPWGHFPRDYLRAAGPPGSSYQTSPFGIGVRPQMPRSFPRFSVWQ